MARRDIFGFKAVSKAKKKPSAPKRAERGPRGTYAGAVSSGSAFNICLGDAIVQRRKTAGLLQGELAQKVGISQSAWCRYERGTVALEVEQLVTIARALAATPAELLEYAQARLEQYEAEIAHYSRPSPSL